MERSSTYVCIDYEVAGDPQGADPANLLSEVFVAGGATLLDHPLPIVASFDDAGAAMEVAIVAQWRTQREINDARRKLRIGVHLGELADALAVMECSNGNQIVFSGTVDVATGGTLDARPMALANIGRTSEPTQLWLSTDSRPDIDGRPLRIPT
ncbi:MAG: hypothetical protein QF637_08345 [Acidimicrobiales bacterium]|nr:hypothetical protein [Acidimicrobiales bacterium]